MWIMHVENLTESMHFHYSSVHLNLRNSFIALCRDGYYGDNCSAKYQRFLIIIAYYNYTDFSHVSSQLYLLKD